MYDHIYTTYAKWFYAAEVLSCQWINDLVFIKNKENVNNIVYTTMEKVKEDDYGYFIVEKEGNNTTSINNNSKEEQILGKAAETEISRRKEWL